MRGKVIIRSLHSSALACYLHQNSETVTEKISLTVFTLPILQMKITGHTEAYKLAQGHIR